MSHHMEKSLLDRFLHSQSSSSLILLAATICAVIWANSPWAAGYHSLSHLDIGTHFAGRQYHLSLDHWVKDGLMAIFFFVVGLEIKREMLIGELSSFRRAALPVAAALGGAVLPAVIYLYFNRTAPASHGWGIPMATDIAFALGVLALFGSRVPTSLKVFLTALAIVDDLLAVLVIALFYTTTINLVALGIAFVLLVVLALLLRSRFRRLAVLFTLVVAIWLCVYLSGIHATIAGVLIALCVPIRPKIEPVEFFQRIEADLDQLKQTNLTQDSAIDNRQQLAALSRIYVHTEDMIPPGIYLEQHLHSIQAFLILPLFALFAAGVTVEPAMFSGFPSGVSLGIILGLILGKPMGIMALSFLVAKSGLGEMPEDIGWTHLLGVACLAGIGFTMSIFISELGFNDGGLVADAKIAIFLASIASALMGYVLLSRTLPTAPND
jgi:Na+:H+ antiporter, NhaA family